MNFYTSSSRSHRSRTDARRTGTGQPIPLRSGAGPLRPAATAPNVGEQSELLKDLLLCRPSGHARSVRVVYRARIVRSLPQSQGVRSVYMWSRSVADPLTLGPLAPWMGSTGRPRPALVGVALRRPRSVSVRQHVQHGSTATRPPNDDLCRSPKLSDLHRRPSVTPLPLPGSEGVRGSSPLSST
jgi:hypothetical protein